MSDVAEFPTIGEVYEDSQGRLFKVNVLEVANKLGREVRGTLVHANDNASFDFSTTLNDWRRTWRDKKLAADPGDMRSANG